MFNNKKKSFETMNILTNSDAYKAYMIVTSQREKHINKCYDKIDSSIISAVNREKYATYIEIYSYPFYNYLYLKKNIKNYLKSKGYKSKIFILFGFDGFALHIFVNWKFKTKKENNFYD